MTDDERRDRYLDELITTLRDAMMAALIVRKDPTNATALRTAGRLIGVAKGIHRDIRTKGKTE